MDTNKTLIVNLFGAPGAGKSTGTAYVFSKLKLAGINAEIVSEFAKDKVWEGNGEVFKNQVYIFGKQSFKISRCVGKVDVIITDSPLLLSSYYNDSLSENFDKVVFEVFNSYNNVNFFIHRSKAYNPIGRFQTEEESDLIKDSLRELLINNNVEFTEVDGGLEGYDAIANKILEMVTVK